MNININIRPTPNPNANKFILDVLVKAEDKSTYKSKKEAKHNPLAQLFFDITGVDQVHFFQNVITISKFGHESWDEITPKIEQLIRDNISDHDPEYTDPNPEKERRESLSAELQKIETILDDTIRPGLQGDGGDLSCLSYEDNVLIVRYEGACGTCPSSNMGTLEAIKGILRDQFNPEIDVYATPSEFSG